MWGCCYQNLNDSLMEQLESFFSITRTPPVEATLLENAQLRPHWLLHIYSFQFTSAAHAVAARRPRPPCRASPCSATPCMPTSTTPTSVTHWQPCGVNTTSTTTVLQPFFLGLPRWSGARRELLDFMVQGKINRGRHTDTLGTTPSRLTSGHLYHPPFFTGWMPFLPPNQQCQSTEGN